MDELLKATVLENNSGYKNDNIKNKHQRSFTSKILVNIIGQIMASIIIYVSFYRFNIYYIAGYCMKLADVIVIIGLIGAILSRRVYDADVILSYTSFPVFVFKMLNIGLIIYIFIVKLMYAVSMVIIEL